MKLTVIAVSSALLTACVSTHAANGSRGRIIGPSEPSSGMEWTAAESAQPIALRNLRRSPEASFHLLRVGNQQGVRVHAHSDLVLMMVAGALTAALAGKTFELQPGDVVEIPRGTPYSLTNKSTQGSVAYLVYTPALDPNDGKQVSQEEAGRATLKWNLWVQ